jgi:hypothetical protein
MTTATEKHLLKLFDTSSKAWLCDNGDDLDIKEAYGLFCKNFNISHDDSFEEIGEKFEKAFMKVFNIYDAMSKHNLVGNDTEEQMENKLTINRIMGTMHYARNTIIAINNVQKSLNKQIDFSSEQDFNLYKFQELDMDELQGSQKMIIYIYSKFHELNYKRYKECCYKARFTRSKHNTFSWEKVDTIQNVIYNILSKSQNLNMFLESIKTKDNIRFVIDYFIKCMDPSFPDLVRDRHVFSFNNGIYITKVWNPESNWWTDKFFKYDDPNMPPNLTSCKFFDHNFEYGDECDPTNVHTPLLDSILKYQDLDDDVIMWNQVYIGRMLYDVAELDNWQVILFLLGQGGTGKSTIANDIVKKFYDDEDTAVMSNNIQAKFGLADIHDKFIFIAPEIKRDWCLEQSEFQEIISAGTLNVNIKHKKSEVIHWKSPGILGGNEVPGFCDNSGSIKRRVMVTRFDNKVQVKDGNTMLGKELQKEIPSIIKKCNMLYLEKARCFGRSNIWDKLPSYFIITQEKMSETTNPLVNYLNSGKLTFDKEDYIPLQRFVQNFNEHCRENGFKKQQFTTDFYNAPFGNKGLHIDHKKKRLYNGINFPPPFIIGVNILFIEDGNDSD